VTVEACWDENTGENISALRAGLDDNKLGKRISSEELKDFELSSFSVSSKERAESSFGYILDCDEFKGFEARVAWA
jgi:hypothetical protein